MPWQVYNSAGQLLQATDLPDNAVTNAKVADDAIDSAELVAGSVDNAHLADDAVGIAELSATGTASSSTFLRGDNAWAAAGGGNDISVQVYNDATISIANLTTTILTFNSEDFDTDTMHDNSTNNSRLTATTAGKYLVVGKVEWQDSTTGNRWLLISNQDGATQAVVGTPTTSNTSMTMGQVITALIDMDATNYVELRCRHNHGSALNAYHPRTMFGMTKVLG